MRPIDSISKMVNNPVIRAQARRFGVFVALIMVLASLAGNSAAPQKIQAESGAASQNRLWTSGAETQSSSEFNLAFSTSIKHSGAASFRDQSTSGTNFASHTFAQTAQTAPFWFRFYFYINTMGTNASNPIFCGYDQTAVGFRTCVRLTSSRTLSIGNETAGSPAGGGNGSTVLSTGTWYRIEWALDTTTTTAVTNSLRINGVNEITGSNMNLGGGITTIYAGHNNADTVDYYFDDIAINGNTARSDNWPGDGNVIQMNPNAAGDNTGWTKNGAGCTSLSNYQCVNEVPPDGSTTFLSATTGVTDDYTLSSSGLGTNDLVKFVTPAVQNGCSFNQGNGACTNSGVYNLRVKASSGGTVTSTSISNVNQLGANYEFQWGNPIYTLPGTNNPWQTSDLSTTQIGAAFTSGTPKYSAIWLTVEYSSATGGRLWTSGAELQSTTAGVETTTVAGSPTISTSVKHSGAASYRISATNAVTDLGYTFASTDQQAGYYFRFYMRDVTNTLSTRNFFQVNNSAGTQKVTLQITSAGKLNLNNFEDSVQIGSTSTNAISATGWTRVELKMDTTTLASTSLDLRMDGVSVASGTANLQTGIANITWGILTNVETVDWYFDDFAINKNVGSVQNSFPGDGNVIALNPGSAGDNAGWTTNGTCTGGHFGCVNETTPNDATNFVSATTANAIEDYNIADPTFNTNDGVTLVAVGVRFNTAAATEEDFRVRLKDAASGVPIESNNINPASTTWGTNATANPRNYPLTAYTRPEQSTSWTKSTVTSAQIGVRDFNAGTGTVQVSAIWLTVEYAPITISGTVYSTDESTAVTTQPTVTLEQNGTTATSTTAETNGNFTIEPATLSNNDVLVVYLNTNGGIVGATVTVSGTSTLTGIDIYRDRLATRCDNSCSLTNANIDTWDKGNDTDIHATVTSSNLTVDNDWKLLVKANTYAPGGTVTTSAGGSNSYSGDVEIKSGATFNIAANALSIGGSYAQGGTFTASNTTTFSATATGKTLSGTMTSANSFNTLVFNGVGGGWTFSAAARTATDFTITNGTVTGPTAATINVANNYTNNGTFTASTSTVNLSATTGPKALSGTLSGSSAFYNLTFNGVGGSWTMAANTDVTNNFTITNGTVTAPSGTLTIGNNYSNSATFTNNSGTVTFNATATGKTIATGGSAFYNLTFDGVGGGWTFSSTSNVSNNLTITNGTVDDSGNQITGNATGTMTMGSGGTLKLGSGTATTFPATFTAGHTTLNAASTVIYNATVNQTISGTPTYGNVQLSRASGTPTKTLGAATTIAGSLTIDSSNTLDTSSGNNYAINLAGNYTNNGTFTARTSVFTLNGSAQQTLTGTMTSTSAFSSLTITNASGSADPGCGTSFTPSVIFSGSATITTYTITTASVKVRYNSASTYTITNINWNGQASGTKIQFRNSNLSSGTWLLAVSGTQTAVSYVDVGRSDASSGNQIVASNGTNLDCNNNTNWLFNSNTAPNTPTSLVQKRTTAGTTLATGDWTNETKATFTVSASDTDNPDTLALCVEVIPIASSFTNTETGCGSAVAYSGTPVTLTYNNTTISDATEYKWQARVKDTAAAYSSWADYGANGASRDFGVDTTAPTTGTVNDGTSTDVSFNDGSLTALSANWSGFSGTVSGIAEYDYSIGTTAGGVDIKGWTNNSTSTSVTTSSLVLRTNVPYYTNVRALDNAGNTSSVVSSNGQSVLPQLTFSLSSNTLTFSNLNAGNNLQNTQTTTITTSTNAYGGYVVTAYAGGLLTSGSTTIPMFASGTYASPASWGSGTCSGSSCGFGYTSSDTTINGSNKFGTGTLYAPFSLTAPGDTIADHTTAIDGTSGAVSNESFTITCKVAVTNLQPSLTYSGTIYYIATSTF